MEMERDMEQEAAQNLLVAVNALTEAGFAVTKAEAIPVYGRYDLAIRCTYVGFPESSESEPVVK